MNNTVLFILFFIGVITIAIIWEIFRTKCPNCGKFFARQRIKKLPGSFDYDRRYDVHSRTTVTQCKCKFCNYEWTQQYTSHRRKK